ncbi:MAG: ATP-binding protein [Candidatus Pseudomonas phytovorans]|uniref:histidine kinase n=1 Tax=Candidatus Pseudomonas phytovorans TaxID=3121377 RepID=A0AAJ6BF48_9PSED|nr:ATP-binding protein [Pseudomonas sp.]WEK33364.1 MAG: ATP-binding protein [Pseudomonas sp.]
MLHQLSLLLCLALVASHLLGIVLLHYHGSLLHPLSRNASLERLATAYHAARELPPGQSSTLLAHMGNRETRFWVARQAEVEPFPPRAEEQRLANDLRTRLALPAENSLTLQLERVNGADARTHLLSPAGWAPLQLRSSLALGNGLFLNAIQHPSGAYQWSSVLAYSLPVTTLPVLLVVVFCISRVLRPVKSLARATERVSRGEWIAPLPLAGPAEARELTHAFNTMQARLARHVEGRTRLLAAISHDLNTPLTELRLQVELLEPGEARDDMLESLEELSTMVRETLGFVRDDAVQEPTRRIALDTLLGELARRYGLLGQALTLGKPADAYLYCRPLALKRALTNLIDNALKHGGTARVDVQVQAGMIVLEILDRGPGLPEAWLEKVFEPFVQLGHGNGGLGLGLAIARACVQAHGGELVLENRQPAGLCAVLKLPQCLEDQGAAAQPPHIETGTLCQKL